MADEETNAAVTGQPEGTPDAGTTTKGTEGAKGKSSATAQTTAPQGTDAASGEDTFFDPKELDPSLMPAYKNMQRSYGKKMEEIKAQRQKVEAYDAFSKDPIGQIQAMASRLGYKLTRADAAAVADAATQSGEQWAPQTWGEVMARAKEEVLREISPMLTEIQTLKKSNIEKMLDDAAPDWREHEDEMVKLLGEHPTLAKDPVKLYRMALPPELLETRATQAALKKLQSKADAAKVGGTSTTKSPATVVPDKAVSFNEAVEIAKRQLAEKGLRPPT